MARGKIRQRGPNTWQIRAYAGVDPDTGKARELSETVHGPRSLAEDRLAYLLLRAMRKRDGGAAVSSKRREAGILTVFEGFEAWRTFAKANLEPNGADTDEDILRNYVYPHLGDIELWRLRPNQLAAPGDPEYDPDLVSLTAFYYMLAERGSRGRVRADGTITGRGRPLGSQAIRRTHGVIRRALAYCLDRGWVSSNAAIGAKMPPVVKRTTTTPPAAALAAFVDFLEQDDPEILCFLDLMNSGARRVDMGLQWAEVSFAAEGGGAVTFGVRGLITARDENGKSEVLVRTTPTRKRKLRTVALDAGPASRLMALRTHQEARAALCGISLPDTAYVFSGAPDGSEPRNPNWFSGGFRNAKKRAAKAGIGGLAGVRPYDVRHFMITQLLAHGVAPAVVAERAGNSQRTMDAFYRHAVPAQDQAAAELMARIMREASSS
jgi:integrase